MIREILLPFDFSDNSKQALKFALAVQHKLKAHMTLIHTLEVPYDFAARQEENKNAIEKQARAMLKDLIKGLNETDPELNEDDLDMHVLEGEVPEGILRATKEHEAGLVLMPTIGASGLKRFFLGSHTADVIHKSKKPVLVIPPQAEFKEIANLVFATCLKDKDIPLLTIIDDIAAKLGTHIVIAHIREEETSDFEIRWRGMKEFVREKVFQADVSYYTSNHHNYFEGIEHYLAKHPGSLLVMGRSHKSPLRELFGKSHSEEMAYHANVPLLVF